MTKALQGIAVMSVIGFVGLTLLQEGRSGPNAETSENERVDVNGSEKDSQTVFQGTPYSVAKIVGTHSQSIPAYVIGRDTAGGFVPLVGATGLWYSYETQSAAVEKCERLNNPLGGGAQSQPETQPKVLEPYDQVVKPSSFDFGTGQPQFGW